MSELKTMKPTYKIFILDEDEFNDLHKYIPEVNKEDLKEGLGFANPKTRECFVKRTGVKEWDDETVIHEAEELLTKHSSDEDENNIRWKKGGAARFIVPALVGILSGGLGLPMLLGTVLSGVAGAGMGAYAGKKHPEELGGAGRGALTGGITGALSGMGGSALGAGAVKGATAAGAVPATSGFLGRMAGGVKGAVGAITGIGAGADLSKGAVSTIGDVAPGLPTQAAIKAGAIIPMAGSPWIPTTATGAAQLGALGGQMAAPTTLGKLATPSNLLGATAIGASMLPKTPEFQMPSSVEEIRGKLLAGGQLTPLGLQAQGELQKILSSTPTEISSTTSDAYYQAMTRRIEENYAEALKQLDKNYNIVGMFGSGEHLAEKAKLQEQMAKAKSDIGAQIEQQRYELASTQKYNAIAQALNLNQQDMSILSGLAGYDVQTAANYFKAKVEDIEEIRKALGSLGSELIIQGQPGYQQGLGNLSKIFGALS